MEMSKIIGRLFGLIRFHLSAIIRRKSIHYLGIKQYLGKGAHLLVSEKGKITVGRSLYVSEKSNIGAHLSGILEIGNNNFFNTNTTVTCLEKITIGNDNLFAQNVVVVDHNHNYDSLNLPICRQGYKFKPVTIGSDCWICANVVICPGATIGDHIIVAANSVVSGTLEKPGVYAGAPAKLIKKRE